MTSACERLSETFACRLSEAALFHGEQVFSRRDLLAEAHRRLDFWRSQGLNSGERVLLLARDRLEYLIAFLAAALGGFEIVTVSQKAAAEEVEHIRRLTRPRLEWSAPSDRLPPPLAEMARPAFANVRILFFTSGTTSLPKGVCHDLETLLANADAFNRRAHLDASVRMVHVMPAGYMAGILNTFLSPLIAGGSVILGESFDARSALSFWSAPMRHGANAIWLTPTMAATLTRVCRDENVPAWTRENLRHVFVGTAPLHAATRQGFHQRFGVDCLESYGMTECMFVSVNPPGDANPDNSVGLLLDGVEVEARNPEGERLPAGGEGDLWVRSAYTLAGYLDVDSGQPVPAVTADGWLDTGDIGRVAGDGRMTITGRRKDLIIHGGSNVSPKRVEEVLLAAPGIRDASVVGVPHPFWGEEVLACLILEPGAALDTASLRAHCSARLAADAVPARFCQVDEFPRSSAGKVQKHLLRGL